MSIFGSNEMTLVGALDSFRVGAGHQNTEPCLEGTLSPSPTALGRGEGWRASKSPRASGLINHAYVMKLHKSP